MQLEKLFDVNQDLVRNIVSLRESLDLFDDLHDNDSLMSDVAIAAESRVKNKIPSGIIERAFHYSTAIDYPFGQDSKLITRYSDGSYPVWYGSFDLKTTVYETCHHMLKVELGIEGLNEIVIRERAIYDVHCSAALIDLTVAKHYRHQLIADTYEFTHALGRRIQREGYPGLVAPSARYSIGRNAIIFNKKVLSDPKMRCYLTYRLDPILKEIHIERTPGKTWLKIKNVL